MKTEAEPQTVQRAVRSKATALAIIGVAAFVTITVAQLSRYFIGGNVVLQAGNVVLNESTAKKILAVSDTGWVRIDTQVIILLDELLRFPIHPDNLDGVKAQIPSRISLNFNSDESAIITALASSLLVPNTNYDAAA